MPAAHGEALPCLNCIETLPLYPRQRPERLCKYSCLRTIVFGNEQGGTECKSHPLLTFGALLVLGGAPALAGRAVTDDERAKLVSAVSAQGCSGGKMEFDDGKYEVDDARCNDGKIYDLDFNPSFELFKKKLEN